MKGGLRDIDTESEEEEEEEEEKERAPSAAAPKRYLQIQELFDNISHQIQDVRYWLALMNA